MGMEVRRQKVGVMRPETVKQALVDYVKRDASKNWEYQDACLDCFVVETDDNGLTYVYVLSEE